MLQYIMNPDPTGYCPDEISFFFIWHFYVLVFQFIGDWTCLHLACRYGHRDIVGDLIVKYKCDKEKVKKVYNVIVELCILLNIIDTHSIW